eukprot:416709-Prorocentrum_minimum.AAC.1
MGAPNIHIGAPNIHIGAPNIHIGASLTSTLVSLTSTLDPSSSHARSPNPPVGDPRGVFPRERMTIERAKR